MEFAPVCVRNIRDEIKTQKVSLKYLGENFFNEIAMQQGGIEISLQKAIEIKGNAWAHQFFHGSFEETDRITKMSLVQFCTSLGYQIKIQPSDFS